MKVVFLRSSDPDLRWFNHYYGQVFIAGVGGATERLRKAISLLETNAGIGVPLDNGTRRLVIRKTPFSLIYRITPDRIEVLYVPDNRARRTKRTQGSN